MAVQYIHLENAAKALDKLLGLPDGTHSIYCEGLAKPKYALQRRYPNAQVKLCVKLCDFKPAGNLNEWLAGYMAAVRTHAHRPA